eukprot:391645_1
MSLFLFTLLLFISETISVQMVNPYFKHQSCGMTEDCDIICNRSYGCSSGSFYVYNDKVNINCLTYRSCYGLDIFALNVTLLNLTVSGEYGFSEAIFTAHNVAHIIINCNGDYSCYESKMFLTNVTLLQFVINGVDAFYDGFFSSDKNTQQTIVECIGYIGCFNSFFYYQSHAATHKCVGYMSCCDSLIYATGAIAIDCTPYPDQACFDLRVIFPRNITSYQLSYINISTPFDKNIWYLQWKISLFSFYHITPTINYLNGSFYDELDQFEGRLWVYYGYRFIHFCDLTDIECVNNTEQMENENVSTWVIDFPSNLNFSTYDTNNSNILIILSDIYNNDGKILTPPIISNNKYLSILCIFCNGIQFRLHSLQNSVMTYVFDKTLYNSTILGPQKYFTVSGFGASTMLNTYFLNNTKNITINNIDGGRVYIQNQTNVRIHCDWLYGCYDSIIFSSLDPISSRIDIKWNIIYYARRDTNFRVYFSSINRLCRFVGSMDFSMCPFLTSAPTKSPTLSSYPPTGHPTIEPTMEPTIVPSSYPTLEPTLSTLSPTNFPIIHTTLQPTNDTTIHTTLYPTHYLPSNPPNHLLSNPPTYSPTSCNGDCIYYQYDQLVYFDVTFDANNYSKSVLFELCETFFSTVNVTEDTLKQIDIIIMNVLDFLKAMDAFKINKILQYPYTTLLNGMVTCDYNFYIINTKIVFAIQSMIEDRREFDKLFDDESLFVNESQRLLSRLFGVYVNLYNSPTHKLYKGTNLNMLIFIICLIVAMLIVALVGYYIWHKNRNTYFVKNTLVLIIGIAEFDGFLNEPGDQNLPADKDNIRKLIQLWKTKYNYKVLLCNNSNTDCDQLKLKCTKMDVMNFIDNNIGCNASEEMNDYDGIIVHIFSHGQDNNSFLTSDEQIVKLDFIKHELSDCSSDNSIKIIFYHPCRGNASYHISSDTEYNRKCICCKLGKHSKDSEVSAKISERLSFSKHSEQKNNDAPFYANVVTIFGNISGWSTSTNGYFTDSICKIFDKNAKKIDVMKKTFEQLIRELVVELIKRSSDAEICDTKGIGKPVKFTVNTNQKNCCKHFDNVNEYVPIRFRHSKETSNSMNEMVPINK